MTRVGIMTFLHNANYGSLLQAWALQTAVRSLGYDAEHINYAPSAQEKLRNLLASGNSPRLIWEGIRKRQANSASHADLEGFLTRAMALSPVCRDTASLCRQGKRYDVVMCGSDQIWSPVWLNPAYFLPFTQRPRVAYACSLGVHTLPGARKQRRMAALLRPFSAVSVREEEGARIIGQLTGSLPAVMPDPVWLVEPAQWRGLMKAPQGEPYLLGYFIGDQAAYWERLRALSQETGLPVRVIPRTESAYRSSYALEECSPEEWLGLMDGAAHIVTDSFHGTAFAMLFNRPCTILRRYREDDPESKNSRIDQLLRQLELPNAQTVPDWTAVNARMAVLRQQGMEWLDRALAQAVRQGQR